MKYGLIFSFCLAAAIVHAYLVLFAVSGAPVGDAGGHVIFAYLWGAGAGIAAVCSVDLE